MLVKLLQQTIYKHMDKNDIKYILEQLNDAIDQKDWDLIDEIKETLKEFLDDDKSANED